MQPQIPPLCYGMTNKRAGNDNRNGNDKRSHNYNRNGNYNLDDNRRFLRFATE